MKRKPALVTVCGSTCVGKSKIAIRIALEYETRMAQAVPAAAGNSNSIDSPKGSIKIPKGICINGDSMQIYKGLDIVTNKPSPNEMACCKHELFGFLEPHLEYCVQDFVRDANNLVHHTISENDLPVVVGGTHYYLQALLYKKYSSSEVGLNSEFPNDLSRSSTLSEAPTKFDPNNPNSHPSVPNFLSDMIGSLLLKTDPTLVNDAEINQHSSELYDMVCIVDAEMKGRWHPKDVRKLRRCLEIYYTTGQCQSQWYSSEKATLPRIPLWRPAIVFWIYAKPEILDQRLDYRVDEMLNRGMLDELTQMHVKLKTTAKDLNYTRGILQAIGFKEFNNYFLGLERNASPTELDTLLLACIESMKLATRQYARTQIQWMKNKLGPALLADHADGTGAIYVIDATDSINDTLICRITNLIKDFQNGLPNQSSFVLSPNLESLLVPIPKETNWKQFQCTFCTDETGSSRIFNGQLLWDRHLDSKAHKTKKKRSEMGETPKPGDKKAWIKWKNLI